MFVIHKRMAKHTIHLQIFPCIRSFKGKKYICHLFQFFLITAKRHVGSASFLYEGVFNIKFHNCT